ncbi:MAG: lysylphosphatidylglycerol synthase transmembrane domain-containing protein [Dysgonamonadaceae bacterium]|nr:lysylphosphatidylglycerol synthase transmembrane domain-containing protein [Dysgonamonadaceae bacterium]MDD3728399.1 lysylphosphatidylglycerol synthase transmembrane domain-containing protein [Dysgonamonadaceae bacterium]MDD4245940.1 lysylphosphatidylglycerol synthase transmembrane domain-containing protein [Dysgonamonadaceae bacterium]MDD4606393.1 lysylphosphatidylglycerol synthase transmembrane domain-containing protein [Dysgonamonadaceae bacterium]
MNRKVKIIRDLFFVIGILVLSWMVYSVGFDTIWNNIKQTGWWFFAIIGIWTIVYFFNGMAFHVILRGGNDTEKISFLRKTKLIISGFAINSMTPFGLLGGEPYKIIELKQDLGVDQATSGVLLSTMMHFLAHFIFWMASVPIFIFVVPVISLPVKIILWGVVLGALLLIYWAFSVFRKGLINQALSVASRIPFVKKKVRIYALAHGERIEVMDRLTAELFANRKKDFFLALSFELMARFVSCIEIMFMAIPIGHHISFFQAVIVAAFSSLFANILFFSPMQLGTREGGFGIAFSMLTIPLGVGVYVGLITRIREMFWISIGVILMRIKPAK